MGRAVFVGRNSRGTFSRYDKRRLVAEVVARLFQKGSTVLYVEYKSPVFKDDSEMVQTGIEYYKGWHCDCIYQVEQQTEVAEAIQGVNK